MESTTSVLDVANQMVSLGISVIPIGIDGLKQPAFSELPKVWDEQEAKHKPTWEPFRQSLPTEKQLGVWFGKKKHWGLAAIAGKVSGYLECIDLDDEAIGKQYLDELSDLNFFLYDQLVIVKTPRGFHIWYRVEAIEEGGVEGSQKLAWPSKKECQEKGIKFKALIETRGEGGYALVPGCPLECHETKLPYTFYQNDFSKLPVLDTEERKTLISLAKSFDRSDSVKRIPDYTVPHENELIQWYDLHGPPIEELIAPVGWIRTCGEVDHGKYRRPDKDHGWSATIGYCKGSQGEPLFHVFSSSAHPFEPGNYGRFQVLRILQFGGDGKKAFQFLKSQYQTSLNGTGEHLHEEKPKEKKSDKLELKGIARISDLKKAGAEVKWLWPQWIQKGVLVAVGAPGGTGKTRLCADLVRRMVKRIPWPDGQEMVLEDDPRVLWVVADNHHDEMVTLCERFGIEDSVWINATPEDPFGGTLLEYQDDYDWLEARIRVLRPHLVVIDTVGNSTNKDLNRQEDAKLYYQPLQIIARKYTTSILCLTHLNASGTFLGRRVLEKVRTAVRMDKPNPNDDRRILEITKSNSKRPEALGMKMTDSGNEYDKNPPKAPVEGEFVQNNQEKMTRLKACCDWLKSFLDDGAKKVVLIRSDAEEEGYDPKLLYRAKEKLQVREFQEGKLKYWELPDPEESMNDPAFL